MCDGDWTLLPNDKEPGFCFIRHSETRDIAISSLVPGSYEESHFLDLWLPGMMKTYGIIAKGIGELPRKTNTIRCLGLRSGVKVLLRSVRSGCCAKQRKSPGEVTFQVCSLRSIEHVGLVCRHGWHIIFVSRLE